VWPSAVHVIGGDRVDVACSEPGPRRFAICAFAQRRIDLVDDVTLRGDVGRPIMQGGPGQNTGTCCARHARPAALPQTI
jgi:hypothetical protein